MAPLASLLHTAQFIATHPLSSRRPLRAFLRYFRWQVESRLRSEIEFSWIGESKLVVRNGMTGATGNIYCGLHEFVDMAFVLHLLRPGDLFIDVGANIGSYTVLASAVCGASTIAIEPDPDTMRSLRRNVEANGIEDRVELVEAALGANRGVVSFTTGRDTTNRVAQQTDSETREVSLRTLDEVLSGASPCMIKLDVEGYEPQVLAGSHATLQSPTIRAVLIETANSEVRSKLEAAGFCRAIYEPFTRQLLSYNENWPPLMSGQNALYVRDFEACSRTVQQAVVRYVFGQRI